MKDVTVYEENHEWFWYVTSTQVICNEHGPFKVEAIARKDAYFSMGGPIIDAMYNTPL